MFFSYFFPYVRPLRGCCNRACSVACANEDWLVAAEKYLPKTIQPFAYNFALKHVEVACVCVHSCNTLRGDTGTHPVSARPGLRYTASRKRYTILQLPLRRTHMQKRARFVRIGLGTRSRHPGLFLCIVRRTAAQDRTRSDERAHHQHLHHAYVHFPGNTETSPLTSRNGAFPFLRGCHWCRFHSSGLLA